jgi:hypothetical protein
MLAVRSVQTPMSRVSTASLILLNENDSGSVDADFLAISKRSYLVLSPSSFADPGARMTTLGHSDQYMKISPHKPAVPDQLHLELAEQVIPALQPYAPLPRSLEEPTSPWIETPVHLLNGTGVTDWKHKLHVPNSSKQHCIDLYLPKPHSCRSR